MKYTYFFLLTIFVCLCACQSIIDKKVSTALRLAEENRPELEQVLQFYHQLSSDKRKLQAARYLIAYMPGHLSYQGEQMEYYKASIRNELKPMSKKIFLELWEQAQMKEKVEQVEDIRVMKAKYLISQIEGAFDSWESAPWSKDVSFDDFCRYILPYRIYNEQLSNCWVDSLKIRYRPCIEGITDMKKAFVAISKKVDDEFRLAQPNCRYALDILTLDNFKMGNCSDMCILKGAILRALGIPVSYDYINQWTNYSRFGHSWIALIVNGEAYTLQPGDSIPQCSSVIPESVIGLETEVDKYYKYQIDTLKKVSKVYRENYMDQGVKDVSVSYQMRTSLELDTDTYTNMAHLCVFRTGDDWISVCSSEIHHGKCRFENIGTETVYLLMIETDKEMESISAPFILQADGVVKTLTPSSVQIQNAILYRKYPLFAHWFNQWYKMIGGRIEVSNQPDFTQTEVVGTLEQTPAFQNIILNKTKKKYRYIRYVCPPHCRTPIAELEIYNVHNEKLQGTPIGSSSMPEESINNVFDGDLMTVSSVKKEEYWVGLDMLCPQNIEKVVLYPKNDGNFIEIGNCYELFYYHQGWISLGKQSATDHHLLFDIPANALLLLKNDTKGKEERIFIYENNKQMWY